MSKLYVPGQGWGGGSGVSGPIDVGDIDATGTPSASTFLRGDGAWETPAGSSSPVQQHSRYGDGTKGSTNTNIIRFGTAVGTPDTDVISHNDSTYLAEGSIFTILETGTYLINAASSAASIGFGLYIVTGTTPDNTLQTICGGETQTTGGYLCSFANSRKVNFTAGDKIWVYCNTALTDFGSYNYLHSITITKLTKGEKGDQGPAGADGANAYPWTSITQTVGGTSLELTGLDGDVYEVYGMIKSGASSNLIQMEFNGSAGSYAYLQHFSTGNDAGAGSYFVNAAMGNGAKAYFRGLIVRDGTNINGHLLTGHQASGLCHANVNKTISGATAITAVKLTSNQSGGIAADSYIYARKVR